MEKFIAYEPHELKALVKEALMEHEKEKARQSQDRLISKNAARKIIGCAHITVTRLIDRGKLQVNCNGKVLLSSVNAYMKGTQ